MTPAQLAALKALHEEIDEGDGNGPGHGHSITGVWDSDNGALSGQPCEHCANWKVFTALLAEPDPSPTLLMLDVLAGRVRERIDRSAALELHSIAIGNPLAVQIEHSLLMAHRHITGAPES